MEYPDSATRAVRRVYEGLGAPVDGWLMEVLRGHGLVLGEEANEHPSIEADPYYAAAEHMMQHEPPLPGLESLPPFPPAHTYKSTPRTLVLSRVGPEANLRTLRAEGNAVSARLGRDFKETYVRMAKRDLPQTHWLHRKEDGNGKDMFYIKN